MSARRSGYTPTVIVVLSLWLAGAAWFAIGFVHERSGAAASRRHDVVANLFEWNWPSVARECTQVLGPAGYGAVQVAPPQDSTKRTHLGNGSDTVLHPWWEVYQPVDYNLTSRMGNEAQFKQMVRTCRAAGVQVIVDAVIGDMAAQGNVSYGGVHFQRYDYPGVWGRTDFHKYSGQCPTALGELEDYNNEQQLQKCELYGLPDLRTETSRVRAGLAAYLNKLIGYGVSGFRVDAAILIGTTDLDNIYIRLHDTVDGQRPYWALEIFVEAPGALSPFAFLRSGSVLGTDGAIQLHDLFKSYLSDSVGSIAALRSFGTDSGLEPSNRTLSFVQNHDVERNGYALSYKDGAIDILAHEFLLGSGYGRPEVYSSFTYGSDTDQSPPSTADGMITDTRCGHGWFCIDRDRGVRAMVAFHNAVGTAPVRNWTDDGANLIGFSRGDRGWLTINNATTAKTYTFPTGLRAGSYTDLIQGARVIIGPHGLTRLTVPAKSAIAVLAR